MTKIIILIAGLLSFTFAFFVMRPDAQEPASVSGDSPTAETPVTVTPWPSSSASEPLQSYGSVDATVDAPLLSNEIIAASDEYSFPEPGERILAYGMDIVSSGGPGDWAPWLDDDERAVQEERDSQPSLDERAPLPVPDTTELYELAPELARESNEAEDLTLQELLEDPDFEPVIPGSTTPPRRPFFVPSEDMD